MGVSGTSPDPKLGDRTVKGGRVSFGVNIKRVTGGERCGLSICRT